MSFDTVTSTVSDSDQVDFIVGLKDATDLERFSVDQALMTLLCRLSEVIKTAAKYKDGAAGEGLSSSGPIQILIEKPATFGVYLEYLKKGFPKVPKTFMSVVQPSTNMGGNTSSFRKPMAADGVAVKEEYVQIANLYTLCKHLHDLRSKNIVTDMMFDAAHAIRADGQAWLLGNDAINDIYEGTGPDDKMRQLLIDLHVDFADETWLSVGDFGRLSHQYLHDCHVALLKARPSHALVQSTSRSYDRERYQDDENETAVEERKSFGGKKPEWTGFATKK